MTRYDTSLEAAGAEFLVIGRLLIERVQTFRAHANQPGYDLIATRPPSGRTLRIQVKSRVAVDSGAFHVRNLDFDVIVFVRLNRGTRQSLKSGAPVGTIDPAFYVMPVEVIAGIRSGEDGMRRIRMSTIADMDSYRDRWDFILDAFDTSRPDSPAVRSQSE